ncbi:hypothetical protein FISHEDRAFT_54773 [Fistulina hepatica ATCC 64428]|uniref:Nucleolar protein 12 n=1 Tax=Fistulina hepatica ATCC 64428 TaxID=1128425 RepID=A0A0D7AQY3_9AGAR|nr:hypothetical protein FISHEDRAFT_54773 [Fistulina hepatica ATCC 64428]
MSSNLEVLTRSHAVIAAKKRNKKNQIQKVVFDDTARREFLTGFHKRKLARAEAARKKATEREKQERLEARREASRSYFSHYPYWNLTCAIIPATPCENAALVENAYGGNIDPSDPQSAWEGIAGPSSPNRPQREDAFEDDQVLATVTVVEDFDPDTLIRGPSKSTNTSTAEPPQLASNPSHALPARRNEPESRVRSATYNKPVSIKSQKEKASYSKKRKSNHVKYETKAARQAVRSKQRARHTEKAERAGGKRSRKQNSRR